MKTRSLGVAAVFLSVLFLSACGGGKQSTERALTSEEASILAEVLFRNYEAQGASFYLAAQAGDGGGTITVEGIIDWKNHQGAARVFGGSQPYPVEEVWWSRDFVAERRPTFDEVMAQVLPTVNSPVLVRKPDAVKRRLDQILAIVTGLSSQTPDNAQLLLQMEGSAFIRTDELRNRQAIVLRYGKRTVFWLDQETKALLRFEGNNSTNQYPVVVDFLDFGRKVVQGPQASSLVNIANYGDQLALVPLSP